MGAIKGTITRRLDSVLDDLIDEFKLLCDKPDFENKIEALKEADDSARPSKLRELFVMFDKCKIKYERGKDNAYYEELVRNSDIPSFSEIEDRMMLALFSVYEKYAFPEDYMKRIVDRLCCKEDGWENDTLRLRILKQFIKYGNYLNDAKIKGKSTITSYISEKTGTKPKKVEEVLSQIDDDIFKKLSTIVEEDEKLKEYSNSIQVSTNERDIKKYKKEYEERVKTLKRKVKLLRIADDLATGKFRVEGATKKSLYYFAMVYGMSFYSGGEAEIIDYKTDIDRNLFRDYYTNNMMRFISDAYRGKLCEFELDPSGQGINYKNYAEMIYLYYISKDCSPQEKIKLSSEMIKRVSDSQSKQGKTDTDAIGGTKFYKKLFTEDILSKPELEFEQFICQNYDCDAKKARKIGPIQMESEQNSAFKEYKAILQKLTESGLALENCNYGLWFTDVAAFKKKGYENICDRRTDIDRNKFGEFMELLLGINEFIGYTVDETASSQNKEQEWNKSSKMKTKALYVDSPNAVTRTSLIVAYYYYYNAIHENVALNRRKNFEEVFKDFAMDLDPKLDNANYQPLSGKNIFDVLVTFSSYAYMNV